MGMSTIIKTRSADNNECVLIAQKYEFTEWIIQHVHVAVILLKWKPCMDNIKQRNKTSQYPKQQLGIWFHFLSSKDQVQILKYILYLCLS
jgi:hypothetical protein